VAYLNEYEDAAETKSAVEREGRRCILRRAMSRMPNDSQRGRFCADGHAAGQLDILVNNAGFSGCTPMSFLELTEQQLTSR